MSTLYVPVLITTTEQAEALPTGSLVLSELDPDPEVYVRIGGVWVSDGYPGSLDEAILEGYVPTALVPIEADEVEETAYDGTRLTHYEAWFSPEEGTP